MSSINRIPPRYQEAPSHTGDHITVTLPFVRTLRKNRPTAAPLTPPSQPENPLTDVQINTGAPFPVGGMCIDALIFTLQRPSWMVCSSSTSQFTWSAAYRQAPLCYHAESIWFRTSAKRLHSLMEPVGDSVYWQKIFSMSKYPMFLFLAILWYALYAWDESFELLYSHVSDLESQVLGKRIELAHDIHVLQAHLLHCQSLLHDFEVSVAFIEETSNPAMESDGFTDE